jgi:hypothetical protein
MNPSNSEYFHIVIPLISELKLSLTGSFCTIWIPFHSMRHILSNMLNLSYLTIKTTKIALDGNDWKNILIQYVPKIKLFQLNMNLTFDLGIEKREASR